MLTIPIFLNVELSYLDIFSSKERLCSAVEAIDVREGLYQAYDADAQLLEIIVDNGDVIRLRETGKYFEEKLRELLYRDLKKITSNHRFPEGCWSESEPLSRLELLVALKSSIDR